MALIQSPALFFVFFFVFFCPSGLVLDIHATQHGIGLPDHRNSSLMRAIEAKRAEKGKNSESTLQLRIASSRSSAVSSSSGPGGIFDGAPGGDGEKKKHKSKRQTKAPTGLLLLQRQVGPAALHAVTQGHPQVGLLLERHSLPALLDVG